MSQVPCRPSYIARRMSPNETTQTPRTINPSTWIPLSSMPSPLFTFSALDCAMYITYQTRRSVSWMRCSMRLTPLISPVSPISAAKQTFAADAYVVKQLINAVKMAARSMAGSVSSNAPWLCWEKTSLWPMGGHTAFPILPKAWPVDGGQTSSRKARSTINTST